MKKLDVSENAYYQEQYENKGFIITNGPTRCYLIWESPDKVLKAVNTLEDAEDFTNTYIYTAEDGQRYTKKEIQNISKYWVDNTEPFSKLQAV